jgi:hypothetical protein
MEVDYSYGKNYLLYLQRQWAALPAILFEFIGVPSLIRPFLGARRTQGIIPRRAEIEDFAAKIHAKIPTSIIRIERDESPRKPASGLVKIAHPGNCLILRAQTMAVEWRWLAVCHRSNPPSPPERSFPEPE